MANHLLEKGDYSYALFFGHLSLEKTLKALLFGSWSKGNAGMDSDIDVALISSAFSGDRFSDRRRIVPFRRRINNNIEPVPFDPESFEQGGNLIDEIRSHGEDVE